MNFKYPFYMVIASILFCILSFDHVFAQIHQYQAYKVTVEGSFGEPETTYKETDIILDLNRDRISIINPEETNIYNILLEMENQDEHGNYIRTFQVEGRTGKEEFRIHFLRRGKDSEPENCIFEMRSFGGVTANYFLKN